ncbi:FKBP-type peptidyl-prolyl cis-trans isomerase [Desulfonatronum thioautotrophicum]|uniref:FKBP-type peptidyl-prolyl cis-trans isomerase n=1 Tax=Desulfonatronum thioautotrophicum TaxID=617001 RepID=UPI0005EB6C4B|nr:FKBP-type peptidyl-prolyl cis-trans isomerase [Desulfonatronum thioautotrophicum]
MSFRKSTIASCLGIFFGLGVLGCGQEQAPAPQVGEGPRPVHSLETDVQRTSYAIGLDIGTNIAMGELEVDVDAMAQGLRDGLGVGGAPLMTQEEQLQVLAALQQDLMQKQMEMVQMQAAENIAKGEAFMAEFREQEGVQATESGILFRVIEEGDGEMPRAEDIVTVHYTGTLVDGTVFDSSLERGEPATFPLQGVIPGWIEILQIMPQGSKWEVVIPPDMAYGPQQAGPLIEPNSTLVFEIELLDIIRAEAPEQE